jgi:hypothetical protein
VQASNGAEFREAIDAFTSKRPPAFEGLKPPSHPE